VALAQGLAQLPVLRKEAPALDRYRWLLTRLYADADHAAR